MLKGLLIVISQSAGPKKTHLWLHYTELLSVSGTLPILGTETISQPLQSSKYPNFMEVQ